MSLKHSDKRQVFYQGSERLGASGDPVRRSNLASTERPIATAPSDRAIRVVGRDGGWAWAHYRRDGWKELVQYKDFKTGASAWRESGRTIDATAWSTSL